MKKTLISVLALSGVAMATTFTTTNSVTSSASDYGCKGFIFNLNGSALTTTSSPNGSTIEGLVKLESITLTTGSTSGWAGDGKFSLVITDTDFSIVGWSTTISTANKSDYSWSFVAGAKNESVILDSSKSYLVLADSATSFTAGDTLIKNNKIIRLGSSAVSDYGTDKLDFASTSATLYSGLEFITVADPGDNNAYESYTIDNSTRYAPKVTIVTTSVVPEPTTATLSLLALAGLAARRRRK